MNKPDDVSAEAWEAAEVAAKEATRDAMRDPLMPYYITVTPHIARAIDAAIAKERERCAKIAFFTDVPNATAMKIHDAIRNPSKH